MSEQAGESALGVPWAGGYSEKVLRCSMRERARTSGCSLEVVEPGMPAVNWQTRGCVPCNYDDIVWALNTVYKSSM